MKPTSIATLRSLTAFLIAACLTPGMVRAVEPVEQIRRALKIDPGVVDIDVQKLAERRALIEQALPELKSINQLRRAYFLKEWVLHGRGDKDPVNAFRVTIGKRLIDKVRAAAQQTSDQQIAVARMISELAVSDEPTERGPNGKFASVFTDLLVGSKDAKGLVEHSDIYVRQCALDALGKITPKPAAAKPALRAALKGTEVGPRRIAAYALTDLVKNAHYLERGEEMETIADALAAAVVTLYDLKDDEVIRIYCLQTVAAAARVFTDYRWSTDTALRFTMKDEKVTGLDPDVRRVLQALYDANPSIASALRDDPNPSIRLTALDAFSQLVMARGKIMEKLAENQRDVAGDKRVPRTALFGLFKTVDPIGFFLEHDKNDSARMNWEIIPALLKKDHDVGLRRAAMALLELVAEDVETNVVAKETVTPDMRRRFARGMTPALYDKDRFVRWTAARTVRYISLANIDEAIVVGLGHMLIDPVDRDSDLSRAAAEALESIAESKFAASSVRFLKSAITDREKDVEIREAAMRTLVQIGGDAAHAAFPEVTSVLTDPDVRIRRIAAETLGLLGRPLAREAGLEAIAALKIALRDEDQQVRHNASEALLSIVLPR